MLTAEMFQVLEVCHVNGCDVLGTDDLVTLTAVMFQNWRAGHVNSCDDVATDDPVMLTAVIQVLVIQSC